MRLLDQLRKQSFHDPTFSDEDWMNRIIEHQSEFPSKLRPAITAQAFIEFRPRDYLRELYRAVRRFFYGRIDQNENVLEEWHGLDNDVDTEEEAELAIRCFPLIFDSGVLILSARIRFASPIFFLASYINAVSFVPLFLKLCAEFNVGIYENGEKILAEGLEELLFNNSPIMELLGKETTSAFDEESLAVLVRVREQGLMTDDLKFTLIEQFVDMYGQTSKALRVRRFSFFESRLRLIIDWNPIMLHGIICDSDDYFLSRFDPMCEVQMFELIFELGMIHFPTKLGFMFHMPEQAFSTACRELGTKMATQIVVGKITSTLKQNNNNAITPLALVIAAATDCEISIDGLYVLLRCNFALWMPEIPISQTRKRRN